MREWLPLLVSSAALVVAGFALLRANRIVAGVRRALAHVPAADPALVALPDAQGALNRVGVVRFDAFADVGGKLSSAAAVLDDHGNGLVITTLHGRDANRSYLKHVRQGVGLIALSPEEEDAVTQARAVVRRSA